MDWTLIIAYALTIVVVLLPITAIPIGIISAPLGRVTQNVFFGILLGSLIVWFSIDLVWIKFVNGHIPVLAFALCLLTLSGHTYLKKDELNDAAKFMIGGEQWALVLLCIYTMITSESIRWY